MFQNIYGEGSFGSWADPMSPEARAHMGQKEAQLIEKGMSMTVPESVRGDPDNRVHVAHARRLFGLANYVINRKPCTHALAAMYRQAGMRDLLSIVPRRSNVFELCAAYTITSKVWPRLVPHFEHHVAADVKRSARILSTSPPDLKAKVAKALKQFADSKGTKPDHTRLVTHVGNTLHELQLRLRGVAPESEAAPLAYVGPGSMELARRHHRGKVQYLMSVDVAGNMTRETVCDWMNALDVDVSGHTMWFPMAFEQGVQGSYDDPAHVYHAKKRVLPGKSGAQLVMRYTTSGSYGEDDYVCDYNTALRWITQRIFARGGRIFRIQQEAVHGSYYVLRMDRLPLCTTGQLYASYSLGDKHLEDYVLVTRLTKYMDDIARFGIKHVYENYDKMEKVPVPHKLVRSFQKCSPDLEIHEQFRALKVKTSLVTFFGNGMTHEMYEQAREWSMDILLVSMLVNKANLLTCKNFTRYLERPLSRGLVKECAFTKLVNQALGGYVGVGMPERPKSDFVGRLRDFFFDHQTTDMSCFMRPIKPLEYYDQFQVTTGVAKTFDLNHQAPNMVVPEFDEFEEAECDGGPDVDEPSPPRFITHGSDQLPYTRPCAEIHRHSGQQKLFLVELEFLQRYYREGDMLVYVGAAPGHHLKQILEMYPRLRVHAYDGAQSMAFSHERLVFYSENFTEAIAERYWGQDVLLICDNRDINFAPDGHHDHMLAADRDQFADWVRCMVPKKAMGKVRLPHKAGRSLHINGEMRLQVFHGSDSTEARIITDAGHGDVMLDNDTFNSQLHCYNCCTRCDDVTEKHIRSGKYAKDPHVPYVELCFDDDNKRAYTDLRRGEHAKDHADMTELVEYVAWLRRRGYYREHNQSLMVTFVAHRHDLPMCKEILRPSAIGMWMLGYGDHDAYMKCFDTDVALMVRQKMLMMAANNVEAFMRLRDGTMSAAIDWCLHAVHQDETMMRKLAELTELRDFHQQGPSLAVQGDEQCQVDDEKYRADDESDEDPKAAMFDEGAVVAADSGYQTTESGGSRCSTDYTSSSEDSDSETDDDSGDETPATDSVASYHGSDYEATDLSDDAGSESTNLSHGLLESEDENSDDTGPHFSGWEGSDDDYESEYEARSDSGERSDASHGSYVSVPTPGNLAGDHTDNSVVCSTVSETDGERSSRSSEGTQEASDNYFSEANSEAPRDRHREAAEDLIRRAMAEYQMPAEDATPEAWAVFTSKVMAEDIGRVSYARMFDPVREFDAMLTKQHKVGFRQLRACGWRSKATVESLIFEAGKRTLGNMLPYIFYGDEIDQVVNHPEGTTTRERMQLHGNMVKAFELMRKSGQSYDNAFNFRRALDSVVAATNAFNPTMARAVYQRYRPGKLYLPCAGWGGMLFGAAQTSVRHVYLTETRRGGLTAARDFMLARTPELQVTVARDATDYVTAELCDMAMMCPPYYDKEQYGERYPSYERWLAEFVRPLVRCVGQSVSAKGLVCLVMQDVRGRQLCHDFEMMMSEHGWKVREVLGLSHTNSKNAKPLFVFERIRKTVVPEPEPGIVAPVTDGRSDDVSNRHIDAEDVVLDIGSGDGSRSAAYAERLGTDRQVVTLDPSNDKADYNIKFEDLCAANTRHSFGDIIMSMSLHHMADPEPALRKALAMIPVGGSIYLREHDADDEAHVRYADEKHREHGDVSKCNYLSKMLVLQLLREYCFDVERVDDDPGKRYSVLAMKVRSNSSVPYGDVGVDVSGDPAPKDIEASGDISAMITAYNAYTQLLADYRRGEGQAIDLLKSTNGEIDWEKVTTAASQQFASGSANFDNFRQMYLETGPAGCGKSTKIANKAINSLETKELEVLAITTTSVACMDLKKKMQQDKVPGRTRLHVATMHTAMMKLADINKRDVPVAIYVDECFLQHPGYIAYMCAHAKRLASFELYGDCKQIRFIARDQRDAIFATRDVQSMYDHMNRRQTFVTYTIPQWTLDILQKHGYYQGVVTKRGNVGCHKVVSLADMKQKPDMILCHTQECKVRIKKRLKAFGKDWDDVVHTINELQGARGSIVVFAFDFADARHLAGNDGHFLVAMTRSDAFIYEFREHPAKLPQKYSKVYEDVINYNMEQLAHVVDYPDGPDKTLAEARDDPQMILVPEPIDFDRKLKPSELTRTNVVDLCADLLQAQGTSCRSKFPEDNVELLNAQPLPRIRCFGTVYNETLVNKSKTTGVPIIAGLNVATHHRRNQKGVFVSILERAGGMVPQIKEKEAMAAGRVMANAFVKTFLKSEFHDERERLHAITYYNALHKVAAKGGKYAEEMWDRDDYMFASAVSSSKNQAKVAKVLADDVYGETCDYDKPMQAIIPTTTEVQYQSTVLSGMCIEMLNAALKPKYFVAIIDDERDVIRKMIPYKARAMCSSSEDIKQMDSKRTLPLIIAGILVLGMLGMPDEMVQSEIKAQIKNVARGEGLVVYTWNANTAGHSWTLMLNTVMSMITDVSTSDHRQVICAAYKGDDVNKHYRVRRACVAAGEEHWREKNWVVYDIKKSWSERPAEPIDFCHMLYDHKAVSFDAVYRAVKIYGKEWHDHGLKSVAAQAEEYQIGMRDRYMEDLTDVRRKIAISMNARHYRLTMERAQNIVDSVFNFCVADLSPFFSHMSRGYNDGAFNFITGSARETRNTEFYCETVKTAEVVRKVLRDKGAKRAKVLVGIHRARHSDGEAARVAVVGDRGTDHVLRQDTMKLIHGRHLLWVRIQAVKNSKRYNFATGEGQNAKYKGARHKGRYYGMKFVTQAWADTIMNTRVGVRKDYY